MPQHSSYRPSRILLDALLIGWVIVTLGGAYRTFTHKEPQILAGLTFFSYGMLAPYQKDSDVNTEPVVIAWDASGASRLLRIEKYFPGVRGERNSRMRLEKMKQDFESMKRQYEPILTQILLHEHAAGREYVRLDLFWEVWPRSPLGYEALRMQSKRYFVTHVR